MPKALNKVWHAVLPRKLKSYGISGRIFNLTSSFLSTRQLHVVLDGMYLQEYPVNTGVSQDSIYSLPLFQLYIFFFICYLAASRPTLSHCQGDSLTNAMLITEFMILISTQRSPRVSYEVGSQSPAMNLEEFAPGTFRFLTFLMILSIILLTVLTILPSTLSVTIWFVAVTRFDFLTWIWPTRHCKLGQETAYWFQCWKNSACFVWPV